MFFDKISSAEHTFAAWAEKELTKLVAGAPKIEAIAATVLKYAGPAIQIAITMEAGEAAGAEAGAVLAEAQKDLVVASSLIYDFGANPTITSILKGVGANLSALLSAGHVKNAKAIDAVTKVVANVNSLAAALPATS